MSELRSAVHSVKAAKVASAVARIYGKWNGPRPERQSLYFAKCHDTVKIGRSSDPKSRLSVLQTGAPGPLTLIASIPNYGHMEAECHRRLAHVRLHGEWFIYTEEVNALIQEMSVAARGAGR